MPHANPSVVFSDNSVTIQPFTGQTSEDITRWLQRFQNYADFRNLSNQMRAQLLQLLCKDVAADFLDSLDDVVKNSFHELRDELIKRFELPSTLSWKRAADVWERKQAPNESVETYMAAILNLTKKAGIDDEKQVCAALINGFRPAIKQSVLQRDMSTRRAVMESA